MGCHSVFGDINGQMIPLRIHACCPVNGIRQDHPSHGIAGMAFGQLHVLKPSLRIRHHGSSGINIQTDKVYRTADDFHILLRIGREYVSAITKKCLGILSEYHRIKPKAFRKYKVISVTGEVNLCSFLCVFGRHGISGGTGSHKSYFCIRHQLSDHADSLSMGFQNIMSHVEKLLIRELMSGSMHPLHIPASQEYLRFIKSDKMLNPSAKFFCYHLYIGGIPVRNLIVQPPALTMKRIGQIPVIQCGIRLNSVFLQFIQQVFIELNSLFIDLSGSVRNNPRPGKGETIRL